MTDKTVSACCGHLYPVDGCFPCSVKPRAYHSPTETGLLQKYTERLASQESMAIDNFIKDYIPKWQVKLMTALPLTKKLFGWEIVTSRNWDNLGKRIELRRYGQNVADLKLLVKMKGLK